MEIPVQVSAVELWSWSWWVVFAFHPEGSLVDVTNWRVGVFRNPGLTSRLPSESYWSGSKASNYASSGYIQPKSVDNATLLQLACSCAGCIADGVLYFLDRRISPLNQPCPYDDGIVGNISGPSLAIEKRLASVRNSSKLGYNGRAGCYSHEMDKSKMTKLRVQLPWDLRNNDPRFRTRIGAFANFFGNRVWRGRSSTISNKLLSDEEPGMRPRVLIAREGRLGSDSVFPIWASNRHACGAEVTRAPYFPTCRGYSRFRGIVDSTGSGFSTFGRGGTPVSGLDDTEIGTRGDPNDWHWEARSGRCGVPKGNFAISIAEVRRQLRRHGAAIRVHSDKSSSAHEFEGIVGIKDDSPGRELEISNTRREFGVENILRASPQKGWAAREGNKDNIIGGDGGSRKGGLGIIATTSIRGGSRSKSIWQACNVPLEHRKCWVMTSVFRSPGHALCVTARPHSDPCMRRPDGPHWSIPESTPTVLNWPSPAISFPCPQSPGQALCVTARPHSDPCMRRPDGPHWSIPESTPTGASSQTGLHRQLTWLARSPRAKRSASLHDHTSFDRIVSLLQLGPLYATPRRSPLVDPRLHAYGLRATRSASLHDHTSFDRIVSLLQLGPLYATPRRSPLVDPRLHAYGLRGTRSAPLHDHTSFDRIVSLLQLGPLYATPRRSPLVDPRLHAYGPLDCPLRPLQTWCALVAASDGEASSLPPSSTLFNVATSSSRSPLAGHLWSPNLLPNFSHPLVLSTSVANPAVRLHHGTRYVGTQELLPCQNKRGTRISKDGQARTGFFALLPV
ncbi:hypothetical protein C8R46DRAFT_1044822 [Mycena filopes]|nr:hypothetical protein C8R46DRAFT_1044822 [Mycena filopes]